MQPATQKMIYLVITGDLPNRKISNIYFIEGLSKEDVEKRICIEQYGTTGFHFENLNYVRAIPIQEIKEKLKTKNLWRFQMRRKGYLK